MSDCVQQIYRAIQSYDDRELSSYVEHLAEAARQNQQTVECLIIDLKLAINLLPASALREHARRELRDTVVRVAIRAYYDGVDSSTPLASR